MCEPCSSGRNDSYVELYTAAYSMATDARESWVREQLMASRSYCLCHRRRISRNIQRMQTQTILQSVTKECRDLCIRADANDSKLIQHRTFRLVHKILRHTYRPGGRMFRRCALNISLM